MKTYFLTGIGQDSHRFLQKNVAKPLVIGGVVIKNQPGFQANSDGDIILHALCRAISSITGVQILGALADELCFNQGITDSRIYLQEALKTLKGKEIVHVAISLEALKPKFSPYIEEIKLSLAEILSLTPSQIGITATTGEGLNECGLGFGVAATCLITVKVGN